MLTPYQGKRVSPTNLNRPQNAALQYDACKVVPCRFALAARQDTSFIGTILDAIWFPPQAYATQPSRLDATD